MSKRYLLFGLVGLLAAWTIALIPQRAIAHGEDLSVAEIRVERDRATVTLTFPTAIVATADDDGDGQLVASEVETHREDLSAFLQNRFALVDENGRSGELEIEPSDKIILPADLGVTPGFHSTAILHYRWPQPLQELTITYGLFQSGSLLAPTLPLDHCIATIHHNGQVKTAILNASNRQFVLPMEGNIAWIDEGWWVAIAAAFVWGAAHALSPGHGKTMLGAYLVGTRATPVHALFLGLTTTITHTAGVFLLGAIALFASRYILPEQLFPWFGLFSGAIVISIGINLFRQRWRKQHAHHHEAHSHHHHHHHHHHHPHEETMSWRNLLALGISGGLVPCPAAVVLLLSTIGLGYISYGLLLVSAFSIGLAATLTVLGLLLLNAKRVFRSFPVPGGVMARLSTLSAGAIALVGVGIAIQAIWQLMQLN